MASGNRQKVEPTNIVFAIDVSGSMADTLPKLVHSYNTEILATQKKTFANAEDINGIVPDNELCHVTLITFAGHCQINVIHKDVCITEMEEIKNGQLVADGMTALRTTIVTIDEMLLTLKYPDRKTMIFILTDGEDTDSLRKHTCAKVKGIFERYERTKTEDPKHCISATFIGSNQDAIETGGTMGLHQSNTLTFKNDNIGDAISSMGKMISRVITGEECSPCVSQDDRIRSDPDYSPNSANFIVVDQNDY